MAGAVCFCCEGGSAAAGPVSHLLLWAHPSLLLCRVWGIKDIAPLQSLSNSSGWITALHWLEGSLYIKLTVASMDRMVGAGSGSRGYGEGNGEGSLLPPARCRCT